MTFLEALKEWNDNILYGAKRRFAKAINRSEVLVGEWVNGRRTPGEETMRRIAKELGKPEAEVQSWFQRKTTDANETRFSVIEKRLDEMSSAIIEIRGLLPEQRRRSTRLAKALSKVPRTS